MHVSSEVRETNSFKDIVNAAVPGTTFVFDLDNMLITPKQTLGSDQWFEAHLAYRQQELHEDFRTALHNTIDIYNPAQMLTEVSLVEPCIADEIAGLQAQGYNVLGLTTRGEILEGAAVRQLASVGINFNHGIFMDREVNLKELGRESHAKNGIVFCGGRDKGKCLDTFLSSPEIDIHPQRIVFGDDKLKNVLQVQDAAKVFGCPFVGFRYGKMDAAVNAVDRALGDAQAQILSDEEMKLVLAHRARVDNNVLTFRPQRRSARLQEKPVLTSKRLKPLI